MIPPGRGPLPVRDAAERRGYVTLLGLDPDLAVVSPQAGGGEQWRVPRPGQPELELTFVQGEGALDDTDLHDLSILLVQAVPTRPDLLGPAYLDVVLAHLSAAQQARERLPRSGLDGSLAQLVGEMEAARRAVQPLDPEQLMLPDPSFVLPDEARAAIPSAPCPVDALGRLLEAGWGLVDDHLPGRRAVGMLRHPDGGILEVRVDGDQLLETRILERGRALRAWIEAGWTLSSEVRQTLLVHLGRGRLLEQAVTGALKGLGTDVRGLVKSDAGNGRTHRYFMVDQHAPRRRASLLAVITDAEDHILGRHLLEGPSGFEQLVRVIGGAVRGGDDEAAIRRLLAPLFDAQSDPAEVVRAILPRPGDAARVFTPEVADGVERAAEVLRASPPSLKVRPEHTELTITVADQADLAKGVPSFPGAYTELARWLAPGTRWATWVFHAAGQRAGMRYDGLVRIDDRWAWFPKPWRMVEHG